jgi:isopentenyl phosphate kinase
MTPIVIKLGGSVVTDKNTPFKVNDDLIDTISKEVYASNRHDIVLIHGGGSVGHYIAKKIGFEEGTPSKPEALSYILLEMDKLTAKILSHLVENGNPTISLPTHAIAKIRKDGSAELNMDAIKICLIGEFMPLLKGDLVLSENGSHRIVSGDYLAAEISKQLSAEKLIMCIDQDGVVGPDGNLVEELSLAQPYQNLIWPDDIARTDVTGGMRAKLEALKEVVQLGIPVSLLCPARRGRLLNAITGKPFRGTRVVR